MYTGTRLQKKVDGIFFKELGAFCRVLLQVIVICLSFLVSVSVGRAQHTANNHANSADNPST